MFSDLAPYYLRWFHDRPVGITSARRDELRRLHAILYRCAEHFALHYTDYVPSKIPLGPRELAILEEQSRYPFRAGTWRPDYIVTPDGELKLCEITSRFFAHGIFLSWFAEYAADRFMERFPGKERETHYQEALEYMRELPGGRKHICVLKSADRTSEIRLYKRFYERHGCTVDIFEAEEVEPRRCEWAREGTFVVSALNQQDLLDFQPETLRAMMDKGMISDFRNIFLIHDKRFLQLWYDDDFTGACLNPEETAFLRAHAIPTWAGADPAAAGIFEDARAHKDGYILKPCRLGKSEGVHAGPLEKNWKWRRLWRPGRDGIRPVDGMVIQPFLAQRSYPLVWEGKHYDDYLCGMLLCIDDRYFDSGLFRTSSLPVTNIGDDRKACAIQTDDPDILSCCDIL